MSTTKARQTKPSIDDLVEVRRSPIHGSGVFAKTAIPVGQVIGHYEGERVQEDGTYVLWIDCDVEGIYGIDGNNSLRYVNHSARPNASFEGEELISIRPINRGEEITFHYGEEWDDVEDLPTLEELESVG